MNPYHLKRVLEHRRNFTNFRWCQLSMPNSLINFAHFIMTFLIDCYWPEGGVYLVLWIKQNGPNNDHDCCYSRTRNTISHTESLRLPSFFYVIVWGWHARAVRLIIFFVLLKTQWRWRRWMLKKKTFNKEKWSLVLKDASFIYVVLQENDWCWVVSWLLFKCFTPLKNMWIG